MLAGRNLDEAFVVMNLGVSAKLDAGRHNGSRKMQISGATARQFKVGIGGKDSAGEVRATRIFDTGASRQAVDC